MKLFDLDADMEYSMSEIKSEYIYFKEKEPYNHSDNFKTEWYLILMDTINGRNNCDIIGLTTQETSRIILRLRKECIT